jgi:hypothetical protein
MENEFRLPEQKYIDYYVEHPEIFSPDFMNNPKNIFYAGNKKQNNMKLQIDFENKTIKIEEKVNLGKLFSHMEELFPDLKWREFDLEVGVLNNWVNPIVIYLIEQPWTTPPYPAYPNYPWVTYYPAFADISEDDWDVTTTPGVYNISIS